MLNFRGESKDLCEIFEQTVHKTPPAGAGDGAAPKLLQQAYLHDWKPIAWLNSGGERLIKQKYATTDITIRHVKGSVNPSYSICCKDLRWTKTLC